MDNITHSLAGALTAEAILRFTPESSRPRRRGALHLASILANNLPDLDFAYSFITEGKLGYLLHHRGHTHTVLLALVMSLVLAAPFWWWVSRSKPTPESPEADYDRYWILGISATGGVLHLLMDLGNSYGVHPFWPFDNRWLHGDTIFIIEPLLWVGVGGTLCFLVKTATMRGVTGLVALLGLGFVWLLPVPVSGAILTTLTAFLVLIVAWRVRRPELRLSVAVVAVLMLYSWQVWARSLAGARVARALSSESELHVVDLVRSPVPATAWCWDVIVVAREGKAEQSDYVLRLGRVALWPSLVSPSTCPRVREQMTAPVKRLHTTAGEAVLWDAEYRLPLGDLAALWDDCWFRAFARFSRVPYYDPARELVGDLRYDRSAQEDFAEFHLPKDAECPRLVPPWVPPRADILAPPP